ncbi:hypothetical protein [Actinokineospora fastidiosa]|uniref:hypothetical protein n=1 Tax=Actinokineospora fastidiosa TaxID=1816 RepID=UPI0016711D8A|nr:hypothetical protein [Actinokineospora fastidiosa]
MWTAGSAPVDLDATWPAALIERIVTSFSEPAARVVLLARPAPHNTGRTLAAVGDDGVIDRAPGTDSDPEVADAAAVVERLGRTVRVEHLPADPTSTGPASRPFWADLVTGPTPAPAPLPTTPEHSIEVPTPHPATGIVRDADLIVTSLPPAHCGDHRADLVALFAAHSLRVGGILAVLTHCDWTSGELTDPTGAVVAAGQNADLLYLQHIVALHAPVRDGRFDLPDSPADDLDEEFRARHRALVRGLPAPHRRIHSDVLVFAQPHDHQPPPPLSANIAAQGGDRR